MKTLQLTLLIGLFCSCLVPLTVTGQDLVPGVWVLDGTSVEREMRTEDKEILSKLPPQKRQEVMDELGSRTFSFLEGGSFMAEWVFRGRREKLVGKWYTEDGKLFIDSDNQVNTYTVQTSTEEKLILVPHVQKGFFQKLIFTKLR